jgi:catechol 1,2-dioxygenase
MINENRRRFLRQTGVGLAAAGATGLVLRADARPTPPAPHAEEAGRVLIQLGPAPKELPAAQGPLKKTAEMPYGPAYRQGAPFRAKLSPPFEPGTYFLLSGRVWAFDTKRPLAGVVLDFWHVDNQGRYSAGGGDFKNRGRLVTAEDGSYELESIRPVPYQPDAQGSPQFWRCAHFHLLAARPGYKTLVTEIHFRDDPKQKVDGMYRAELAVQPERRTAAGQPYEQAVFDIVLEPEAAKN